mmetsp:Transcript_5894/g.9556  ORF Transcript_5894/g.9556 Transcript_5894/m.9556 type:complete len:299 (+) Transcript_5894:2437-3333(+)
MYKGPFAEDLKEGKGEEVSLKHKEFKLQGVFKENRFYKGTYVDREGNATKSKTGFFLKNNRLDGEGLIHFKNGDKYEGDFKDGQRSGKGTMTYLDRSQDLNGYGLNEPTKMTYTGQFKHNKRNGKGVLYHDRDGTKYEGTWNNDEKAYGKQTIMPGGNIYTGPFFKGHFHGIGSIHYRKQNVQFEGIFNRGANPEIGKLTYLTTFAIYIGEVQIEGDMQGQEELIRQGCGILFDPKSLRRFESQWDYDQMAGVGKIFDQNGNIYIGGIDKGLKQGPGKLIKHLDDGRQEVFEGTFSKD